MNKRLWTKFTAGAALGASLVVSASPARATPNLQNPGFENANQSGLPTAWNEYLPVSTPAPMGLTGHVEGTKFHGGSHALFMKGGPSSRPFASVMFTQPLAATLKAGELYRLTAWVAEDPGSGKTGLFDLGIYAGIRGLNHLAFSGGINQSVPDGYNLSAGFQKLAESFSYRTGQTTNMAGVFFWIEGDPGGGVYVDDVSVVDLGPSGAPEVDSSGAAVPLLLGGMALGACEQARRRKRAGA